MGTINFISIHTGNSLCQSCVQFTIPSYMYMYMCVITSISEIEDIADTEFDKPLEQVDFGELSVV